MELWDSIKEFYKEKFDIEPEIVELFCDFSVLLLCASGSSNKSISGFLDVDVEEVEAIIRKWFVEFGGWEYDLEFNPLKEVPDCDNPTFVMKHWMKFEDLSSDMKRHLYFCVCNFRKLEKKLNDNWI